jgi:hypothetical protein
MLTPKVAPGLDQKRHAFDSPFSLAVERSEFVEQAAT